MSEGSMRGDMPSMMHGFHERRDGLISEDRSKACNLPTDVHEKEFPRVAGRETGRYDDLFTGASKQMTADRAYFNRDLKPSKF